MFAVKSFFRDYFRLLLRKPLEVANPERPMSDSLTRAVAERFTRGNIAIQEGLFFSETDRDRLLSEVANASFRN